METNILKMNLSHLPEVMRIEREAFSDPWSQSSFQREILENTYAVYFVMEVEGKIAGYIGAWIVTDELHITNLAVDKRYRKLGLAQRLIDSLIDFSKEEKCEKATLEVRVSNIAAIKLYKKKGFISVGTRPKYYSNNNEDALIMWKNYQLENTF
ncbi:ribosomal protein S18-alanine N-acetyltransferase [Natronospora cellulosivora (SeqCode)]